MSNWQKLKGKLTAQGVIKPKAASSENDQVNVDGKRKQKQMQRETNVATIKAQHLKHFVKSKYIGLDCEMVGLGMNGKESALARCCCVDFDGSILYDKFVRPKGFVTDFRTEWSGVRKKDLRQGQAIEFSQCQEEVAELLKGRILVGHALKNDLDVLMLSHPRQMIRDTAKYRPYMRPHGRHGKFRPRALRDLTQQFLGVKIQSGEHNPAEDANSAMQLYRLKMDEWEEGLREAKIKAKQAAIEKQKNGTAAKSGSSATVKTTAAAAAASGGGDDVSDEDGNSDADSESDESEGSSDDASESEEEEEVVSTKKPSKKVVSSNGGKGDKLANKRDKPSNKLQHQQKPQNQSHPELKRKVTTNMFGEPVGVASSGGKMKSIAEIDMEMAAKKRKLGK